MPVSLELARRIKNFEDVVWLGEPSLKDSVLQHAINGMSYFIFPVALLAFEKMDKIFIIFKEYHNFIALVTDKATPNFAISRVTMTHDQAISGIEFVIRYKEEYVTKLKPDLDVAKWFTRVLESTEVSK